MLFPERAFIFNILPEPAHLAKFGLKTSCLNGKSEVKNSTACCALSSFVKYITESLLMCLSFKTNISKELKALSRSGFAIENHTYFCFFLNFNMETTGRSFKLTLLLKRVYSLKNFAVYSLPPFFKSPFLENAKAIR